jgi:hypothetical protein
MIFHQKSYNKEASQIHYLKSNVFKKETMSLSALITTVQKTMKTTICKKSAKNTQIMNRAKRMTCVMW